MFKLFLVEFWIKLIIHLNGLEFLICTKNAHFFLGLVNILNFLFMLHGERKVFVMLISIFNHYEDIPAEVAYRICAIRELFEETGVLLAYKKSNLNHGSATAYGSMLTLHDDIACKWRKIVHDNALNFIEMCRYVALCTCNLPKILFMKIAIVAVR